MPKILTEDEKTQVQGFLQKVQKDFSEILGVMVAVCKVVDAEGNVLFRLAAPPQVCNSIMQTEKGMDGCNTSCGACNSLVKSEDEGKLVQCHAGFLGFFFPIEIAGEKVGAITGCAGLIPDDISEEEMKEKYAQLAEDYGIADKDAFVSDLSANVKRVPMAKMNESLDLLNTTLSTLAEESNLTKLLFS